MIRCEPCWTSTGSGNLGPSAWPKLIKAASSICQYNFTSEQPMVMLCITLWSAMTHSVIRRINDSQRECDHLSFCWVCQRKQSVWTLNRTLVEPLGQTYTIFFGFSRVWPWQFHKLHRLGTVFCWQRHQHSQCSACSSLTMQIWTPLQQEKSEQK